MIKRLIIAMVSLLVLLSVTLSLTGCGTWHGFGRDVEHLGDSIQDKDEDEDK